MYAQRFPDSIQLGDITKIDAQDLPAGEWILSGGFPCQDISIAGKGAGIHGERSGLWFEYWRLIRDLRPRFAIMENVGMLIHRGLREVLGSLAEIGYDAEWQDIRASDVGAPHRRERIWIVAYPEHDGRITRERKYCRNESNTRRKEKQNCIIEYKGGCEQSNISSKIPHPSLQLSHGSGEARNWRDEYTDRIAELRDEGYTEQQIENDLAGGDVADASIPRLQGQEPARGRPGEPGLPAECGEWSTEPDVGMLVDGLSVKLVGGLSHAGMESEKSGTEGIPENGKMPMVRKHGKTSTASSGHKKGNGNNNSVSEMPCESGQNARDKEIKTDAEVCGLRESIQSTGQPYSQNLQLRLSENPRERKCVEAVAWESEPIEIGRLATGVKNRVDRLRGLGNAIVPQIAEILFRQIKEII